MPSYVRAGIRKCARIRALSVPSAGSTKVGLSFSYGSTTDDNGGKLYDVKGESAAVSGGQAVTDVTPNCTVTTKQ